MKKKYLESLLGGLDVVKESPSRAWIGTPFRVHDDRMVCFYIDYSDVSATLTACEKMKLMDLEEIPWNMEVLQKGVVLVEGGVLTMRVSRPCLASSVVLFIQTILGIGAIVSLRRNGPRVAAD